MKVFITFDGDHIGREVGRATLNDDVPGLRRLSQAIEAGNRVFKSWVELCGGNMIEVGGDEGSAEVPADRLDELPAIAQQYAQTVGSTVSVGVGMCLSQAAKAMLVSKLHGGNKILFYAEQMEKELQKAKSQNHTEEDKLAQAYLNKGEHTAPMNPHAFQGAQRPVTPAKAASPEPTQGEHSDAHNAYQTIEDGTLPQPELTHAGQDFEEMFHQFATSQEQEDQRVAAERAQSSDALKQQVVGILQQIKQYAPILEQMKQQLPEVYQAVMAMSQVMVGLAKELVTQEQQPGQEESTFDAQSSPEESTPEASQTSYEGSVTKQELHAGGVKRHHLNLPVGSQIDASAQGTRDVGKIKVQHQDGKQGWIHARAGQILSEDGHSISSRNPSGK